MSSVKRRRKIEESKDGPNRNTDIDSIILSEDTDALDHPPLLTEAHFALIASAAALNAVIMLAAYDSD